MYSSGNKVKPKTRKLHIPLGTHLTQSEWDFYAFSAFKWSKQKRRISCWAIVVSCVFASWTMRNCLLLSQCRARSIQWRRTAACSPLVWEFTLCLYFFTKKQHFQLTSVTMFSPQLVLQLVHVVLFTHPSHACPSLLAAVLCCAYVWCDKFAILPPLVMHIALRETAPFALGLTMEKSAIRRSVKELFQELDGKNKSVRRNSRGALACAAANSAKRKMLFVDAAVSHIFC